MRNNLSAFFLSTIWGLAAPPADSPLPPMIVPESTSIVWVERYEPDEV